MALDRVPAASSTPPASVALAHVDDDADEPLCRICFGPDAFADTGNPAEQLITPCKCSGTVAHVHCTCLYAWRKLRCEQQGFRQSQHCEMCHAPYKVPWAHAQFFDQELLGGALPGPRHCLRFLAGRLRSPSQAAEFALDLYLHAVVLSGFSRGAQQGCFNFNRTLAMGIAMIQKNSQGLAAWNRVAPRGQPGALAPFVQLPLALGSLAFLGALSCEALVLSGIAAYLGAIVGFGAGSVGMLRSTWSLGRRVMGLGFRHARPVVGSLLLP